MIIRSGLIQNKPDVDAADFAKHWRERHGPLAMKVPMLRGYAQNLVIKRGDGESDSVLHSIDGISQLWFDDLVAMQTGTDSPEQQACIEDIGGFLAGVTLAIQNPGLWRRGRGGGLGYKMMAVYTGMGDAKDIEADIDSSLGTHAGIIDYRVNPVAARGIIVDPSVSSSQVQIIAILESWFDEEYGRERALDGLLRGRSGPSPVTSMAVIEYILIQPS